MTDLLFQEEAPLHIPLELSDDEFFEFCESNPEYRIERTAEGRIVVMSGTGGRTGNRNIELSMQLQAWSKSDTRGIAFDSSTLFLLPNTAMRSPDAAWVLRSRLASLGPQDKERYLPLCPDFVIELTSPSDRLNVTKTKMHEWMANGCSLGWLIHPSAREVHVYIGAGVQALRDVSAVSGEGPVQGFSLDLTYIWDPGW